MAGRKRGGGPLSEIWKKEGRQAVVFFSFLFGFWGFVFEKGRGMGKRGGGGGR